MSFSFTDVPPTKSSDFPGFCPDDPDIFTFRGQTVSWLPFRGYCYLFLKRNVDWPSASAECAREGKYSLGFSNRYSQSLSCAEL